LTRIALIGDTAQPNAGGCKTMRRFLFLVGLLLVSAVPAHAQNAAEGQKRFTVCKACHSVEADGRHGVGPNLHGVFGAKAGTKEGFAYSPQMKNSTIVWDEENMTKYVMNPRTFIPGNKMAFPGMKQEDQVRDLMAYLKGATR
jgi:cytochrome c